MNELVGFQFEGKGIRTKMDEKGNPWWVAKDVCDVLEIKKPENAYKRVSNEDKLFAIIEGEVVRQEVLLVNEPGLYALIFQSKKPEALRFKKWITSEVLPSIRKTGSYLPANASPLDKLIAMVDVMKAQDERMKRQEQDAIKAREEIATVANNLVIVAKEQSRDTLTSDQISALDNVLHARFLHSGKKGQMIGLIKRRIKERAFDIASTRTYKEVPQAMFGEVMEIAKTYVPAGY